MSKKVGKHKGCLRYKNKKIIIMHVTFQVVHAWNGHLTCSSWRRKSIGEGVMAHEYSCSDNDFVPVNSHL